MISLRYESLPAGGGSLLSAQALSDGVTIRVNKEGAEVVGGKQEQLRCRQLDALGASRSERPALEIP